MPHGKFYCTTCHNLNHLNIKIKCFQLFKNNNKIILIIWDKWQHITCSHYSPKKSHLSCKSQYVYHQSKDESIFRCHLWLVSMQLIQHNYKDFSCKCHLQLEISHRDQLQNCHFLLVMSSPLYLFLWILLSQTMPALKTPSPYFMLYQFLW